MLGVKYAQGFAAGLVERDFLDDRLVNQPPKQFRRTRWTNRVSMAYLAGMGRLVHKEVGGIRVVGFSLGGEETVVGVPEYSTCFDIGRAPREIISIDNVCLSHGHMDHAAGIAYYFSQRAFLGNSPGRVIAHHGLAPHIQALMAVWADIEGHPSPGRSARYVIWMKWRSEKV